MEKNFREIKVNGIVYCWTVKHNCDGDNGNWLKIWLNKKVIFDKKIEYNFDGNDSIKITPEVVRKKIIEMLEKNTKIVALIKQNERIQIIKWLKYG